MSLGKKEKSAELIYGAHPIVELLKAKKRKLAIIYTTKPTPKVWNLVEPLLPKGLQIQYVAKDVLSKMTGCTDHQSIVGYTTDFIIRKKFFDPSKSPLLLLLDGIQDPRNLGAILRSAYCTNVDGVILTQKDSSPLNAAAIKASAGLAEHLEIFMAPSAASAVQQLNQAGYNLYLAVLENGEPATKIDFKAPSCLVIGSEGAGISRDIRKNGQLITLEQKTADISYNASVAAGILLFLMATKQNKI